MIFRKINTKMQEKQEQIMARKVAMNRKKVKNIVQYQEYADDDEDDNDPQNTNPEMIAVNIDSQIGTNEDDEDDNSGKKMDDTSSSGEEDSEDKEE